MTLGVTHIYFLLELVPQIKLFVPVTGNSVYKPPSSPHPLPVVTQKSHGSE